MLLAPLRELVLDPRALANGNGDHRSRRRGHDRRGKSPVMIALAEAGLSTRVLAAEMDVRRPRPGVACRPAPLRRPSFALAIERLTGDAELAREILELIPSAQRRPLTANCADRPVYQELQLPGPGGRLVMPRVVAGVNRICCAHSSLPIADARAAVRLW